MRSDKRTRTRRPRQPEDSSAILAFINGLLLAILLAVIPITAWGQDEAREAGAYRVNSGDPVVSGPVPCRSGFSPTPFNVGMNPDLQGAGEESFVPRA